MKVPIIRQLVENTSVAQLETTLGVLEAFCEFRGVNETELDTAGELITNICGALEVHESIKSGMEQRDALNAFSKKVLGSIDRG